MKKVWQMFFIIISGEAIFMLPFLIPRIYRPLLIEAWGLTNTDIGYGFAAYGITSTLSYLFGGIFADKYNPRGLICLSLLITSAGCITLVNHPSPLTFILTYAFWGVSTVFLMWGALIKTTHVISGEDNRSTASGLLDSGRGLLAAIASTALLVLVSHYFPSLNDRQVKLSAVRWIYALVSGLIMLITVGAWFSLKDLEIVGQSPMRWEFSKAVASLKNSKVWLLSFIILSSYCGYKGIDIYSIYLANIHRLDTEESSSLMSIVIWLRPFATLGAGIFADRLHKRNKEARFLILTGLLLLCGTFQALLAVFGFSSFYFAFAIIASSTTFVYALRSVYFSVFGDLKIETHLIGTTVGIASFVGFLPDVFFGYVSGRLIDSNPGSLGFSSTFLFTALCLFTGSLSSFKLYKTLQITDKK